VTNLYKEWTIKLSKQDSIIIRQVEWMSTFT